MARDHRYKLERQNPSFSSTLLDQICNSIDGDTKIKDSRFCKKQSNVGTKINVDYEDKEIQRLRGACFIENWMEKKVREKGELEKKSKLCLDHQDALFSSSGSNSSYSDNNEPLKSTTSCFSKPKPIRTTAPERKTERTRNALFYNSDTNRETQKLNFESFTKPKSKNFNLPRNQKQPISPGGRIAAFLNSVFAARTRRNSKNPSLAGAPVAPSFSRSFSLNKRSPAVTGEKSLIPVQGAVRFGPAVQGTQNDAAEEKKRRIEGAAREYLKWYAIHQNDESNEQNDSDDDGASCSSSDLFELDHVKVMGLGCDRYREELPVYETTTRLDRNRVIGSGLTM